MALQLLVAIYACGAVVVGHLGNGVAVVGGLGWSGMRLWQCDFSLMKKGAGRPPQYGFLEEKRFTGLHLG
jgi:hypothetical protein